MQDGPLSCADLPYWLSFLTEPPRLMALAALYTGLRATELRQLDWAWFRGKVLPLLPPEATNTLQERIVGL